MPFQTFCSVPDSKFHGANMGPTWVLSAPDGPHVGPMNLAIRNDRETNSLTQGLCGNRLQAIISKEDGAILPIIMRNRFLPVSGIRLDLIRRIGHCMSIQTTQRHLATAGYRPRQPDNCPRLTPDQRWHTGTRLQPSLLISSDIC